MYELLNTVVAERIYIQTDGQPWGKHISLLRGTENMNPLKPPYSLILFRDHNTFSYTYITNIRK
jgi:hypothetical protein